MKSLKLVAAVAAMFAVGSGAHAASTVSLLPGIHGETPSGVVGLPDNYTNLFSAGATDFSANFTYLFNAASQGWYGVLESDLTVGTENAGAAEDDAFVLKAGSWFYWKEDPIINYAFAVQDLGAPSNFAFSVNAPISPAIFGPVAERVEFAGSITDGGTDGAGIFTRPNSAFPAGVKFDSDGIDEIQVVNFLRNNAGGVLTNEGMDLGVSESFPANSGPYVLGNGDGTPGYVETRNNRNINQPARWINWQIDLAFRGTGGRDAYALTGRAEIQAVPVPAAAWLLLSALGATGIVGRRRSVR